MSSADFSKNYPALLDFIVHMLARNTIDKLHSHSSYAILLLLSQCKNKAIHLSQVSSVNVVIGDVARTKIAQLNDILRPFLGSRVMQIRVLASRCCANMSVSDLDFEIWREQLSSHAKSLNFNMAHGNILFMLEHLKLGICDLGSVESLSIKESVVGIIAETSNYTIKTSCLDVLYLFGKDVGISKLLLDMILDLDAISNTDPALLQFAHRATVLCMEFPELILERFQNFMNHPIPQVKLIFVQSLSHINGATDEFIMAMSAYVVESCTVLDELVIAIANIVRELDHKLVFLNKDISNVLLKILRTSNDTQLQAASIVSLGFYNQIGVDWLEHLIQFTDEKSPSEIKFAIVAILRSSITFSKSDGGLSLLNLLVLDQDYLIRNEISAIISRISGAVNLN